MKNFLRPATFQQMFCSGNRTARSVWTSTYIQKPGAGQIQTVTLIPGTGIGPEITNSVQKVFKAANVPIHFDILENFSWEDPVTRERLKKNRVILLGVIPPHGKGQKLVENYQFYNELGLYADVMPCFSIPGIAARHQNVDVVVIRENSEGEFTGIEHEVYPGVIESIKRVTKENSLKIARYAFEFAHLNGRKKVTAVHKANIMKMADGLFLEATREVAAVYPFIKYEEMIIDNCSMQMVKSPSQFDVMVLPNLYGSIVSNICAGITGGVGLSSGICVGNDHILFAQGNRHAGLDIAGMNIVNPTALLFSSVTMLQHMGFPFFADKIHHAINTTLSEGKVRTRDICGTATTTQYTDAIIKNLEN